MLAGRLRWRFADADTFHSEANIAKMREGIPLTDEDRQPWLRAVTEWIDDRIAEGQSGGDHLLRAQARLPATSCWTDGPPRRWSSCWSAGRCLTGG